MTSYLIGQGHREIGFVGNRLTTSSIMDRYLGYCKALLQHHLPLNEAWVIDDRDEHGRFLPFDLPENMPTAFVCNCDRIAFAFVDKLKSSGYRVPEDISVTGFDDCQFATMCNPALTTYHVDMTAISTAVVDRLIRKMREKDVLGVRTVIAGKCVYRNSVAPCSTEERSSQ